MKGKEREGIQTYKKMGSREGVDNIEKGMKELKRERRERFKRRNRERGMVSSVNSSFLAIFAIQSFFCVEGEGFCGKKLNLIFLRILMNFHIQQARKNITVTK